jgi:replicative DNA helicase
MSNSLPIDSEFFENIIIYNALTNDTYLSAIIDVAKPKYFKNDDIREIFELINKYFAKYQTSPTLTELKSYLQTDRQKKAFKNVVLSFKQLDTKYNLDALYLNTENFLKEKAIYNAVLETANKYSKDASIIDTAETLSIFENACNISLIDDLGLDYFQDVDKHIDAITKIKKRIPTGYKWLDEKLGGGWAEEGRALYVFTGVTNSGKSIVLGNIACNLIKQNKTVVIISLEMSEDMYTERIDGQLIRIPLADLKIEVENLKHSINNYRREYLKAKLFIKEFPPKSVTVNHIKAYLQKLLLKKGLKKFDAVVLDYVNLLQPTIVTGNSYTDIKLVTEQIRALSYYFSCPFITVTQNNRSAIGEVNPGLEATGESLGLSMTADFQASIWSDDQDKELGIIHMGVQKNRFGQNFGTHAYKIDYKTLAIDEMDDDFTENSDVMELENTLDHLR